MSIYKWGRITAIRVQDPYRHVWYNYDNGVWDKEPELQEWSGVYISAYAINNADPEYSPYRTLKLKIIESGMVYAEKSESVPFGGGLGIEFTGAFNPPAVRAVTIELWMDNWLEHSVDFTIGIWHGPESEPEDEHIPDGPQPKAPTKFAVLLAGFPVAVHCLWVVRQSLIPSYVHNLLHPLI